MSLIDKEFYNREKEMQLFTNSLKKGGLYVLYGRRRIGKSRFLREFSKKEKIIYFQATIAEVSVQVNDLWLTIEPHSEINPTSWKSFFELLSKKVQNKEINSLIIDEFPFLVESDPELSSLLQKWVDTFLENHHFMLVCAGSSQRMMHAVFLNGSSPLYGRTNGIFKMSYLDYKYYLKFLNQERSKEIFECYSLLGGVPRYWHLSDGEKDAVRLAENMYFDESSPLKEEPTRILYDEGLTGRQPSLILDLIGRGSHKPSEIASYLQQTQGSLTKPLNQLIDIGIIEKDICFGEKPNNTKKMQLVISDPSLCFWYKTAGPFLNRWNSLTLKQKKNLITLHASGVFEYEVRKKLKANRFWDKNIEIDAIFKGEEDELQVVEVKFGYLDKKKKEAILKELKIKWDSCELAKKYKKVHFKVIDLGD